MKNIKRIIACALVFIMALSVSACHKKDEIAVTIKDIEFTSAYYMCALINADSEAKSQIQSELTEEESSSGDFDIYSKKIDGKEYETWVKDRAIEILKEKAAYQLLCKENKVELNKDEIANAEMYASYYWSSYGYSMYFEPNGVSEKTYTKYETDAYYSEAYFNHLYGKDGEKEIAAKDIEKEVYGNYIVANVIDASFTEETTDAQKKEIKAKLDGYVTALKNGKKTFEQVYIDYNNEKAEDHKHEETKDGPKDPHAQILGSDKTSNPDQHYDTIKKMKTGEIKLIKLDDDAGYRLVVKQDIKADKYYLESLDSTARHTLKDEEFNKTVEDYAKGLKPDVSDYAINQFKVKEIKEPEYQ